MVAALQSPKSAPVRAAQPGGGLPASSSTPSRLRTQGVSPRLQSEWLNPGDYRVDILAVKEGGSRLGRPFFVVECRIMGNTADERQPTPHPLAGQPGGPPAGTCIPQNRLGHTASWMVMLDRDGAQRDVRAYLEAALTADERANLDATDEVYEPFMASITGDGQLLRGRSMLCSATMILTKGAGKPFTKVRWFADEAPAPPVAAVT
jgi:hypothetical protein